ncbi:putative ATBET12 [Quillaja saponaria]|uniref:ATBET12 n=1 Tax=Quillaja saponaria TaxID=32244 RepID=A0AAD7QED3_QUISA|nr:putative ATBET12 [Quillaja saponaria]
MADAQRTKSTAGSRQTPSRLQRRAPSSLQINRSCDWNVAIPLLSPLASSPTGLSDRILEVKPSREEVRQQEQRRQSSEPEKVVFKKWQHPAAPFCYEPASLVPPFVQFR